jgi:hypothetical protein
MVTPYFTPAPKLDCVRVVWNKGTYAKGLNVRPGPTLHNYAPLGTYLGTGFTFRPLAVLVNAEGTFYKLAEPNWWVAGKLNSHPQNTYTEIVTCP